MSAGSQRDELRHRLLVDTPFYAKHCLKVVNKQAQLVPLVAKHVQLRLDAAMEAQREAGLPIRVIVLKSRRTGVSTWTQGKLIQRTTQRAHRKALVVAQDGDTATTLFEIGERMHANLPTDPDLALKPAVSSLRRGRYMNFGQPSRLRRAEGDFGLDSSLEVDTANEVEAGRGYTFTDLHLSEVAFWPHEKKLTALLNAVADEPETMIVLESTANGSNHFKARWDRAVRGEGSYVPVFIGWHEDPDCVKAFRSEEERAEFIEGIGEGPWGEDEPRLVDQFGCTPEQLHWRRQTIVDKCEGKLEVWNQEYPATAQDAFMATGKHVFSPVYVSRVIARAEETDPPQPPVGRGPKVGLLTPAGLATRSTRSGTIEVPTGALWVPREASGFGAAHPFWKVWQEPNPGDPETGEPPGAYVVAVDPASGGETEDGELAYHAIEVIDHRTREQVAEYRSRVDADLIAPEALLAALYYNRAWLGVETTGGYGLFMARRLYRDYRYPKLYKRKSLDRTKEKQEDRLGWDTNRASKVLLEDGMRELLREGTDGIRSLGLALELPSYVRLPNGRTGPEPGSFSDRLLAYMIAQQIAQEKVPMAPSKGNRPRQRPRDSVTGW